TNNITANATSGTNNIEAYTNNIGVATASSQNTMGNAGTSTNVITGATNTITGATTVTSTGTANQMIVDATSSRFVSADGTQSVAVNNSGTTITAATGHTVSVTSSTTTIDGSATIYSGNGTGNSLSVGATQTGTVGVNTFDYGTRVDGGMLIDGDIGVNGNIYTLNTTANASVNIGNNGMTITGASNEVSLQADDDALSTNARAKLSMAPTSASLLVNTDSGVSHGVSISQTSTVISGGTTSTSLTLDDDGATFQDDDTGGPARVMGVANGVNQYDAVNMGQFRGEVDRLDRRIDKAYSGIATVAALAAIPTPVPGKTVSLGLGFGNFESQSAIAVGGKALVGKNKNVTLTAGMGYCDSTTTMSAGIGWSF
ncbi:MAG: YadA-like family protein, partial [Planctomycetes bacterium]|nr:YadA-like family protein [Planctomycetota bacterium]